MNKQIFNLFRILFNPKITATPVRVLRELRSRGRQRLPGVVQDELEKGFGSSKRNAMTFIREWLDGELLSRHSGQWVLNSFLPPFPGKSFNRMFENLLSGRRLSPVSAFMAVTAACPYNCWHCSFKNRKNDELSTGKWLSIIDSLHGLGVSIIGFTGGEPLSRPDLPELVRAAQAGGASTVVFTSGALMDETKALALKKAGLWAFCVSLDHPDPRECDRLRGTKGAYAKAIEAIRISRETGFYTMTGTVVTPDMVKNGRHEILYKIAREKGVHEFRLIEPMPCGKLANYDDQTLLSKEDIETLRDFHVKTNRKGSMPKVCAFNQIESPQIFGCGAGTQHMYIDSAGEVCPCDFVPMSFGNPTVEPFVDIWNRMNDAMVNPRRHCFAQKHHKLITKHAESGYPLPLEISKTVCSEAGAEALPDYFALVNGNSS